MLFKWIRKEKHLTISSNIIVIRYSKKLQLLCCFVFKMLMYWNRSKLKFFKILQLCLFVTVKKIKVKMANISKP